MAALLALPILFLRANLKSPTDLNFFDRFLVRVSAPLQSLCGGIARSVGGAFGRYVHLVGVEAQREKLVEDNARLRAELAEAKHTAEREAQLERLLGLKTHEKVPSVTARVIGAETSPFFRVMRLRVDRGEGEVKPGMPVVSADGVVGRIQRVAGSFSDVLLAVDPKCAIDVVVPRTGARGILHGVASDNKYRARIEYLSKKDEVAVGDEVVTSGIGGPFPRDLPIGKIVSVGKSEVGLYQEAELEPAVDYGRLENVLVLLALPPESIAAQPAVKK
ncbi:MAG: rod shape-determining protein MreC [Polyangia bacterium]